MSDSVVAMFAQCGDLGLQVDGVWLAHEASSSRMHFVIALHATSGITLIGRYLSDAGQTARSTATTPPSTTA